MTEMTLRKRTLLTLAAAALLTAGLVTGVALTGSSAHSASVLRDDDAGSTCGGPKGAAYVAVPAYQGFVAVDTANCDIIQTYNVDDLQVPGDSGDYNYTGSDEGIALAGTTLWFAVTATDNVAAINTTSLNPSDYNPPETLIPVGFMPENLAATPDGSEVWVADSGPQTNSRLGDVEVISTSSDSVIAHLNPFGNPSDLAFSPDGSQAFVTTSAGLFVYDVATLKPVAFVPGLGSPNWVTVSPNGSDVYVTETENGRLATISTATDQVVQTTQVGEDPWQAVVSSDGSTVYVANPDSDTVSVVDAATGDVENSIAVPGAPATLGLTPHGSQLWVAGNDSANVYVIDTATGDIVGETNLGGYGPNSGDGESPTGIVLTSTPTPKGSIEGQRQAGSEPRSS
jgi:YVTN family beta-propeller protein